MSESGEQFSDPNREAVGLPPIGAESDTPPEPEPEPETSRKSKRGADDDETDEAENE